MSPYGDATLPDGSIRLLRLIHHPDKAAHIQCQLLEFPLQKSAKATDAYEALSYVWGSSEKRRTISVGTHNVTVTENLYAALVHLRYQFVDRLLWIDAICINQHDLGERSRQVQAMARIYAKAARVVVWLGDATIDSDFALEHIRFTAETESTRFMKPGNKGSGSGDDAEPTKSSDTDGPEVKALAVLSLLQRPWFQRIWVLQEVAAARHILITCGSAEIDGYTFCLGLNALQLFFGAFPHMYSLLRSATYLMRGAIFRPRDVGATQAAAARFSLGIRPLGDLLDMYHNRQATEVHDKIYALVGMSTDDGVAASIIPNYTTPWEDLFRHLIRLLLSERVAVETWNDREIAIMRGEGRVLAVIISTSIDTTWQDRQDVVVESRNAADYWGSEETWTSRWSLQAAAMPIQTGDIVCLLKGASRPTIVRPCLDFFVVIAITVTPTEPLQSTNTAGDWQRVRPSIENFKHDFLLAWDWEISSTGWAQEGETDALATFINRCKLRASEAASDEQWSSKATKLSNAAAILEEAGHYKEAVDRLQLAVDGCEKAPDSQNSGSYKDTTLTHLAEVQRKHQVEAEKAAKSALEAKRNSKTPIKFRDCVGREFAFPFALVHTWEGIEGLIKNAFQNVDFLNVHVNDGKYDLVTNGQVILPTMWERVIEPGMHVWMHMWPSTKPEPLSEDEQRVARLFR